MKAVMKFNIEGRDYLTLYDFRLNDYDMEFYAAVNNNSFEGHKQLYLIDTSKNSFNYTPFPFKHFKKDWDK